MRALKVTLALAGLLVLIRYFSVYYHASEFNDFVRQEAQRTRQSGQLKWALLDRARDYSLPITEADIKVTTHDGVSRVVVNYRVPMDLFVYHPQLKFQATGTGVLQ